MDLALEVLFAVAALFAVGVSEFAEMFLSPILEKYNVTSTSVRTGAFIVAMTALNFVLFMWKDIDILAKLLNENTYWVTIGLSAFMASGIGEVFHRFKGLIGKKSSIVEIIETTLDAIKEEQAPPPA